MNVLFLDFDGVVNSLIWENGDFGYGYPEHGKVNNFQACQWVSKFCKDNDFAIVISSSWRSDGLTKCAQYLRNGGIWSDIPIIGVTPKIPNGQRGDEISAWLKDNPADHYMIFDDDSDMTIHMDHLIQSNSLVGFTFSEFQLAEQVHKMLSAA